MKQENRMTSHKGAGYVVAAALASALILGGCAATIEAAKTDTGKATAAAEQRMAQMDNDLRKTGAVTRFSGQRVAGEEVHLAAERMKRPKIFDERFVYNTPGQSLSELAENVSRRIGMPVRVKHLAGDPVAGGSASPSSVAITYNDTLAGFFDIVAERTQSYWRENAGAVEFFRTETRSFQVYLPQGSRSVAQSISLGGSGGGGGSAGSVSVSSSATIDAYDALLRAVQGLVAEPGSQPQAAAGNASGGSGAAVANRALGMITVTARPPILDRVAAYVKSVNERFSQNVYINVRVLSLNLNRDESLGITANAILADARGRAALSLVGAATPTSSAGGTPGVLSATISGGAGRNTVDLFLKALSTYGSVAQVTSGQVLAVNGQPSPLQMANDIGYIASSSTTIVPNVGAQTSVTPGSVRVGFTANFTPLILGDNRILLDYSMTLSSATINQVASSGANASIVSTPNVSTQALQQSAFVKDGEAIVLLGFEQNRTTHDSSSGITSVGQAGSNQRQLTVIVMEVFGGRT
jgi:type IVB pilus formation R64 PilN family outer membrane protein